MRDIACIILAAGRGERMKSQTPKVLHQLCDRPMISYVLDLVADLKIKKVAVVLGYKHEEVRRVIKPGIDIAVQKRIVGTADAVKIALAKLRGFKGSILILYGDIPLLKKETIKGLLERHRDSQASATLLTAKVENPKGYGRILRDKYSGISCIVEEKDADDFQKGIKEINTGIICFEKTRLEEALKSVRPNNRKHEYYLTDVISILYKKGYCLDWFKVSDINEALGINSRVDLAKANKLMQSRLNERFMLSGVSIIDPETTHIGFDTKIGQDTIIYPFTVIASGVKIGKRCRIGPFIHLREGTILKDDVTAGNFLEIVRSEIAEKTFAKHFGYVGDSRIGRMVNIGAGCVTANFDGKGKNLTRVKDNAFLGSDTVLVAPVTIGRYAITGAGSVVTKNKNVPDKAKVAGVPAKPLQQKKR